MPSNIIDPYSRNMLDLLRDPATYTEKEGKVEIAPPAINEMLRGLEDELLLIYGRGGFGKTDLMLMMAVTAALHTSVLILSLELSRKGIMRRVLPMLTAMTDFPRRLTNEEIVHPGELSPEQVSCYKGALSLGERVCSNLHVVDDSYVSADDKPHSIEELRRRLHATGGASPQFGLVCIDYVQLLSVEGQIFNSTDSLDRISRGLATIAHTESVPIIGISSVGKNGEIRGTEQLKHDADIILKLMDGGGADAMNRILNVNVEKHRNGQSGVKIAVDYYPASHFMA